MTTTGLREKLGIVPELWTFLRVRKKWWLAPLLLVLMVLGLLLVLVQGTAAAPFIYSIF